MLLPEPLPAGGLPVRPRCAPCRRRFSARCVPRHGWEQSTSWFAVCASRTGLLRTFEDVRYRQMLSRLWFDGSMPSLWNSGEHTLFRPLEGVGGGEFLASVGLYG
jgi:hypothetical protein